MGWTPPTDTGGAPIRRYRLRFYRGTSTTVVQTMLVPATPAGRQGWSSCPAPGPAPAGTTETVDVSAINAAGTGPPSARTVPAAPTAVGATRGNAALTVHWTPATDTGGAPITGYSVRNYRGTSTTIVKTVSAPATATSIAVPGLVNGTGYTVDVRTTNAAGTGRASARTGPVTPATAPGAPTNVRVTRGNESLTVHWTPATDTGGAPITGYSVRIYRGTSTTIVKTVSAPATPPASPYPDWSTAPATPSTSAPPTPPAPGAPRRAPAPSPRPPCPARPPTCA